MLRELFVSARGEGGAGAQASTQERSAMLWAPSLRTHACPAGMYSAAALPSLTLSLAADSC